MTKKCQVINANASVFMRKKRAFDAVRLGLVNQLAPLIHSREEANWSKSITVDGIVGDQGFSLLDQAVESDQQKALVWLLNNGADPSITFCFDRRIDPENDRDYGLYYSPLFRAVKLGNAELVAYLIGRGANPEVPTFILPQGELSVRQYITCCPDMLAALEVVKERLDLEFSIGTGEKRMSSRSL